MKKGSLITVIGVCAAVVLACAAGYFYIQNQQAREEALQLQAERESLQEQAAGLEQEIEKLEQLIREDEMPAAAPEVLRKALGPESVPSELPEAVKAESVQDRVANFFGYLDTKGYAQRRGLEMSSREIFETVLQKLDETRPLVSGENQNLFALMKNITFFYRVLGKDTLLMINDIIEAEAAIMEPIMELFYEWLNPWQPQGAAPVVSPETMYSYAGFFLNSMGGRSYLFRREPGIRMLTLYYSLLVLDRANQEGINSEGIDIGPSLEALVQEMRYSRRLSGRLQYIETLQGIQEKY